MIKDIFTFIVGGKAGEGIRKAGAVAGKIFSKKRRYIFIMDDYPSLIRGGHNFSVVSTSVRKVSSHYMKADLIVALDKRSYDNHIKNLSDQGIIVYNSDDELKDVKGVGVPLKSNAKKYPFKDLILGVGAVAILAAAIGIDKNELGKIIKDQYPTGIEDNIEYAITIYDIVHPEIGGKYQLEEGNQELPFFTGNELIALGAAAAGLDVYFAYPMTPSTSILHYLASNDRDLGITVVQPENEIAVINMAIGSTFTGARTMIASSGGGFALMQEALSLAGMVESPILCIISSRPGPSTGVPTYTEQADLFFALNQGHGEFPKIVASPGSVEETFYLTAELLYLAWQFQTPALLLTEKHMSESRMSVKIDPEKVKWAEPLMHKEGEYKRYIDTNSGVSPLLFPLTKNINKWNSYEHDELGFTTENAAMISKMHIKRRKKLDSIKKFMEKIHTVNIFGEKGPVIFTYGSTTMSVLEACKVGDIEAQVVQPIYLRPFPIWELEKFKNERTICVELNSFGQLATILKNEIGIKPIEVIKKFDGRPFDPIELSKRIKEVVR